MHKRNVSTMSIARISLVPKPLPDFILQPWRKIGRRPDTNTTSQIDRNWFFPWKSLVRNCYNTSRQGLSRLKKNRREINKLQTVHWGRWKLFNWWTWGWLPPSPDPLVGLWQESLSVSGLMDASDRGSQEWEAETTPRAGHCRAVRIFPLWSEEQCKPFVVCLGLISESSCRWEDQRHEGGMLNISNSLLIGIVLGS